MRVEDAVPAWVVGSLSIFEERSYVQDMDQPDRRLDIQKRTSGSL